MSAKVTIVEPLISFPVGTTMRQAKQIIVKETLKSCNGNKTKTARILKMGRRTVYYILNQEGEKR